MQNLSQTCLRAKHRQATKLGKRGRFAKAQYNDDITIKLINQLGNNIWSIVFQYVRLSGGTHCLVNHLTAKATRCRSLLERAIRIVS
jgi:predicted ABC-type transport system involved in lysophospholipase L1 biosynthesis ATPase subunit